MAEIKKIATRESYGNALKELAGEGADKLVVLDADLSAATKTGIFKKAYPNRHINCGIAESNMMCVAAGLSTMGLVPFASSFAMFAAGRAFEQVRNTIGYPHLNVKIGATHAGISVGEDGASHQCCEDFALMRSIPGMVVICPQMILKQGRQLKQPTNMKALFTFDSADLQCLYFTMMIINLKSARAKLSKKAAMYLSSQTDLWLMKQLKQAKLLKQRESMLKSLTLPQSSRLMKNL